jgi:DNA-binding NarL/FixJ family response regulator
VYRAASPTNHPVRILLLEDNDADAALIARELQRSRLPALIERVNSEPAFTAALETFLPDVVLSDHKLARFDSHSALELLRAIRPAVPFIIVTGALSGALTGAAIRAGAEDVVLKSHLSALADSIFNALAVREPLQTLSARQREVLRMIAEGYRTRDIAARLGVRAKTIESHRYGLMKRLHTGSVVSLVRYAIRVGLIPLDPDSRIEPERSAATLLAGHTRAEGSRSA